MQAPLCLYGLSRCHRLSSLRPRDSFPSALSALSTAAPGSLFKATPSMFWANIPLTAEPRSVPCILPTGGLAVPPYPSLFRRDLWTGTGRRTLDDKQRIGQVRCILEKTAIPAVRKTSGSRVTDSAGFAEPSAEDPSKTGRIRGVYAIAINGY